MKEANNIGKNIKYNFGYSNFTFELWLILHKMDCFGSITHRKNYLNLINKAYGSTYLSLSEMKRENNFKEILKKIDINNILDAIKRSESIMKHNEQIGYMLKEYKGYSYYQENLSLNVYVIIGKILEDCRIKKRY